MMTEAEFEIHCNDELVASASGPRDDAWREAKHYAKQYAEDGDIKIFEVIRKRRYPYNPAHACGTCADCGKEMRWNVPRLGPNGGFVHADTGQFMCEGPTYVAQQISSSH